MINPKDQTQLLVSLTGVICNAEDLTVIVTGAHDDAPRRRDRRWHAQFDRHPPDKQDGRERTDATNFREDINANGSIDREDFAIVKAEVNASR